MNAREFLDLQDAYQGVYQELDEAAVRTPKRERGAKDTKSYQDDRSQGGMMASGDSQVSGAGYVRRGGGIQTQTDPNQRQPRQGKMDDYTRADMKYRQANLRAGKVHKVGGSKGLPEEVDTFDAILEHLIAEGYADTNESALVIMANMSEEWREGILDEAVRGSERSIANRITGNDIRSVNRGNNPVYKKPKSNDDVENQVSRSRSTRRTQTSNTYDGGRDSKTIKANKKSINRMNAAKNIEDEQADGDYENSIDHSNPSKGKSGYMEVPTDYRARKRRASGR